MRPRRFVNGSRVVSDPPYESDMPSPPVPPAMMSWKETKMWKGWVPGGIVSTADPERCTVSPSGSDW